MNPLSRNYILSTLSAVIFTYGFHELGHWLAYYFMGYNATFSITSVKLINPELVLAGKELLLQNLAGPMFTLIQVLLFYFLIKIKNNKLLYPFILVPFIFRLLAGVVFLNQPIDEGSLSLLFGWSSNLGFIIMLMMLGLLWYKTTRSVFITKKMNLVSFLITLGGIIVLYCI